MTSISEPEEPKGSAAAARVLQREDALGTVRER